MSESGQIFVQIADRGSFELVCSPLAGSDGVEEWKYTGSVYVQREPDDREWTHLNRVVDAVKAELGINNA